MVVDVLAVVRRDPTTLRLVSTGLHVGGTVMLIVAYLTGRDAAPEVFTPGLAQAVVTRHWDQALWCVWYFGLTTAGRVGLQMRYGRLGRSAAAGLAVVGVGGVLLLATVAELGGRLVYEYGVGVAAPVGDRTLN